MADRHHTSSFSTEREWVMSGNDECGAAPTYSAGNCCAQDERTTESEAELNLQVLLRELDTPEWLEPPQHYDRGETAVHLVARLEG